MNKKIIAIAIASVVAAPVAMADTKVSGHMGGHLTFSPADANAGATAAKSSREFGDAGRARINFDGTSGNAYARIAYNDANQGRSNSREMLAGYKLGGGTSVQFGRMPGVAKNLEKDAYIATFLQIRKTAAEAYVGSSAYGSSGFVSSVIQLKMKMGAMGFKGQYDPSDNAVSSGNSGHIGLALTGKAGAVNYWVAYNNGVANGQGSTSANQVNVKVGASMKMGAAKVTLNVTDTQNGSGGNKSTSTLVMANFGLGNGLSVNGAYGANGDTGTLLRVAVAKKLAKGATLYGGAVTKTAANGGTAVTTFGAGLTVKF